MSTNDAIDWIYNEVAKQHGISVAEVKRRAVENGDRLIGKFSEGKH